MASSNRDADVVTQWHPAHTLHTRALAIVSNEPPLLPRTVAGDSTASRCALLVRLAPVQDPLGLTISAKTRRGKYVCVEWLHKAECSRQRQGLAECQHDVARKAMTSCCRFKQAVSHLL